MGAGKSRATSKRFVQDHRDQGKGAEIFGIGQLAAEFGITARAIRFYESKGLLSPKRVGKTRVYTRRERARLQLILRGKGLGLSLKEIGEYLALYGEHGEGRKRQLEHVIARTSAKIEELEAREQEIQKMLEELRWIRRGSSKALSALIEK